LDDLSMMLLGPLGRHPLKPMHRLEAYSTDVRRARITDAPSLTLQQTLYGLFWHLAAGHQGPFPLRKLPTAGDTSQPFDLLLRLPVQEGLSQSNVSNHLGCLRDCGLVSREQHDRYVSYQISDARVSTLLQLADDVLADVAKGVYECTRYNVIEEK
jgi:DNA-binding transcriptional ArsR family regulator